MDINRRDILKYFGIGATIVPFVEGKPMVETIAKVIEEPKVEIIQASKIEEDQFVTTQRSFTEIFLERYPVEFDATFKFKNKEGKHTTLNFKGSNFIAVNNTTGSLGYDYVYGPSNIFTEITFRKIFNPQTSWQDCHSFIEIRQEQK